MHKAATTPLSPRERQVLDLLLTGSSSKQIGRTLGLSHRTIEDYRSGVLHKLGAHRTRDLFKMLHRQDA